MIKTEAELLAAGCTTEELKSIRRQFRGGVSGARGSQYEDTYATWRLLKAMKAYLDTGVEASVQRQALMPVDDVIYLSKNREEYCQLKTSPDTTWTADDGAIRKQFELQKRICENAQDFKPFTLRLVTPEEKRKRLLNEKLPASLQGVTEVVAFRFDKLTEQWNEGGECCEILKELCAFEDYSPSRREAIFMTFLDVVLKTPEAEPTSLSAVIEEVIQRKPSTALRLREFQLPERWEEAISILGKIENLTIDIIGGFCHYRYHHGFFEEGEIGRTGTGKLDRFLERVIEHEPENFYDFEALL